MSNFINKKSKWLISLLASPIVTFAQDAKAEPTSTYFSNPLFVTLLTAIILLLMLIVAMSSVLKNLTQSEYFQHKYKSKSSNSNNNTTAILLFMVCLAGNNLMAQEPMKAAVVKNDWLIGGLDGFTFYFMMTVIFLEGILIYLLFRLIKGFVKIDETSSASTVAEKIVAVKETSILDKLNASVDIEKEGEIMLDHDYDGIKELDNDLPLWWKYGFYLTVVVAFVYLIHFHVFKTGDLQGVEYNNEVAKAKIELEEYMKTSANNVDETTVKMLEGDDIKAGKEVFTSNCVACHGKLGEGTVGPNLTDVYWLHSGGISDVFKSIKYGWVDKGMKSWKEDLSPMQIAQVASYIKSLAGTNPPSAKAPQGDLYSEVGAKATQDSTQVIADSLTVKAIVKDSVLIKK